MVTHIGISRAINLLVEIIGIAQGSRGACHTFSLFVGTIEIVEGNRRVWRVLSLLGSRTIIEISKGSRTDWIRWWRCQA